jgi:hypothetical protein
MSLLNIFAISNKLSNENSHNLLRESSYLFLISLIEANFEIIISLLEIGI